MPISAELCSKILLAPSQGSLYIQQASMGNTGSVRAMHDSYFRFYVFDSRVYIRKPCMYTFARPQNSSAATAPNFELAPTTNFEIYSTTATSANATTERIPPPFKIYIYVYMYVCARVQPRALSPLNFKRAYPPCGIFRLLLTSMVNK